MKSLRAFLLVYDGNDWSVSVHKDLDSLSGAWRASSEAEFSTGILHLGFERPPSREFKDVAVLYPGKMLLTSSAKFGLPEGFRASEAEVGRVRDMPIYLALRGWGYMCEDNISINEFTPQQSGQEAKSATGWVQVYLSEHPDSRADFASLNIWDDESYLRNEEKLVRELRKEAGISRLTQIIGPEREDPCAFARASPPWLIEREFSSINLSVRVANVLVNREIETVFDLGGLTLYDLLHTQNFGRKSVRDLVESLEVALAEGPVAVQVSSVSAPTDLTLLESLEATLLRYPVRARDILIRRMGLNQPPQTLQEIGEKYDVSRERIRQIESKFTKRLIKEELWDDTLTSKLSLLLHERRVPLPVVGIEAIDPWFRGIGKNSTAFRYLLENVSQGDARILSIEGIEYVGLIDAAIWDRAVSESRVSLQSVVQNGWSIEYCRFMIDALLPETCGEFRDLLWDAASRQCQFVEVDGTQILVGFGRSAEGVVQAVLTESDRPLHFGEIAVLASERAGREIDIRRAHSAAASVGFLFGRGTYGLRHHVPLSESQLALLAQEAEEIVVEGSPGRQWHSQELAAELIERDFALSSSVDKYIVDIALRISGHLERLGRMVWADAESYTESEKNRIDVRQAVISILQEAGGTLTTDEIRAQVRARRGVDRHFQIFPVDPITRIDTGRWGLNDRDLAIKRADQPKVLDAIVTLLARRGKGIHYSELMGSPSLKAIGLTATAFFSLAITDPRLRVNTGRYLYLEEWDGPRRESVAEAVKKVLDIRGSIAFENLVTEVEARIGRPCERSAVSGCLRAIEATYDQRAGKWHLPDEIDDDAGISSEIELSDADAFAPETEMLLEKRTVTKAAI